jgi:beta-lactamase class D
MDRRTFTRTLMLAGGAATVAFPGSSGASPTQGRARATALADAATGKLLHRSGACATRFSPCSTFKIPLALMGFDAGILTDSHAPAWGYDPRVHRAGRDAEKQRTDPSSWESNSVVWYSQEITRRLGAAKLKAYVDRFGYGNRDLAGNPGKRDGLTHSWLMSSLAISPDEQLAFLRRMLAHRLASRQAHALTESIIPVFEGSGGWRVHGKTGSGWVGADRTQPLGWFVGWAEKGKRRLVFARLEAGAGMSQPGGFAARKALLEAIGRLAG